MTRKTHKQLQRLPIEYFLGDNGKAIKVPATTIKLSSYTPHHPAGCQQFEVGY